MTGNALSKVKNLSENKCIALAYYFYRLFSDMGQLDSHEEAQTLYWALVDRLGLQKHSEKVIETVIKRMIKTKDLSPIEVGTRYNSPFSLRGKLKENYREDELVYENCGNWRTNTVRDINLCRILFSNSHVDFCKIIGNTFFVSPEKFNKEYSDANGKALGNIKISKQHKALIDSVDDVEFIVKTLKLSNEEAALLECAFRIHCVSEMYAVMNDLFRRDDVTRIYLYSKCLDVTEKSIRLLLKKDQNLCAYGLINSFGEMDDDAIDAIYEKDMNLYFADIIKREKNVDTYPLNSFSAKKDKTDLAVQFLKSSNSCHILLYGAPGSGKTEYAKALIREAGLNMDVYKNEIEANSNNNDDENDTSMKALGRLNCFLSMKKEDSILLVDEAETVLKTSGNFFGMKFSLPTKGVVNKMLENTENKIIWVVNYTDELDDSTLRRFTYSIRFHEMPKTTLRSIAEKKFEDVRLNSNLKSQIIDMCGQFKVTGASVENIVKAVKSMDYSSGNDEQVIKDVRNVLEANSSLVFGKKKMRDSVKDTYNLDVLNTSTPAHELVEMVENAIIDRENNIDNPEGIRMLFFGLSGTGKTELARYLSEKTGKRLLLKRASDILDKYVGGSEKKIKEAFEEAEETDSILLFDEADSFFSDRNNAQQPWERTLVNEFLVEMENFSGILICTTNLRKIMDQAMLRRFHILMEFKPLNKNGIKSLLVSYFSNYQFNEDQIAGLLKSESVTPGDFGQLKSKMRFVSKDKISSDYIIQELSNIQKEKKINGNNRIGFAC